MEVSTDITFLGPAQFHSYNVRSVLYYYYCTHDQYVYVYDKLQQYFKGKKSFDKCLKEENEKKRGDTY